jgi:uncharacterized membrane protein
MLASQAIVCITLILDIPIARQVLGFLYLIFLPGFILLRIFKLERLSTVETFLFSVGLSITFLLFIGLLTNEFGSIFISKPLSTEPLAIIITITFILMCILCCLKHKVDFKGIDFKGIVPKGLRTLTLVILYIFLPFLSAMGAMLLIAFKSNLLLILIIIAISLFFLFSVFSANFSHHPLAIVSIASALLLTTFLSSNYIYGFDIHLEYLIFNETKNISYWNRLMFLGWQRAEVYNSMLSITVLPTIFSNILNMEEISVFKILYPLIFSLVPLVLYQIYQMQWGKKVAFISAFFFMSNAVFFEFHANIKQMIAELFYVLLLLILLKKDLNEMSKWILLICFGFSLIVSYYTMNYLFLVIIFSIWLCAKIFAKNTKLTSLTVVLFFVLTFFWYTYVATGPIDHLTSILRNTFKGFFEEFFQAESRGSLVLYATGISSSPSFLHNIGRILHNITSLFIVIGFIRLLAKGRKEKIDPEYFLLIFVNMVLLLMCIILPNFTAALQMDRMYHTVLLVLSPLFLLGGKTFFGSILKIFPSKKEKKRESYSLILILILLVTFFLFQTGFVYEITGDPVPSSISLSKYRIDAYTHTMLGLVHENDFFGAMWLSKYGNIKYVQIYSDVKSKFQVLTDTIVDVNNRVNVLSNRTVFANPSYIYLSRYNTITGILLYDTMHQINIQYNISEIYVFNNAMVFNNKLYSNGACEIYYYAR